MHIPHTRTHITYLRLCQWKKKRINRQDAIPDCAEGVKYFRTQMTSPFSDMAAAMYTCFVYIYTGTHTVKGSGPREMIKMCVRYELSFLWWTDSRKWSSLQIFTQRAPEQHSPSLEHQHASIHSWMPSFCVCVCLYVCVQAAILAGISRPGITTQSLSLRW